MCVCMVIVSVCVCVFDEFGYIGGRQRKKARKMLLSPQPYTRPKRRLVKSARSNSGSFQSSDGEDTMEQLLLLAKSKLKKFKKN